MTLESNKTHEFVAFPCHIDCLKACFFKPLEMLDQRKYYEQAGWDQNGIPTSETLAKLKLNDVDKAIAKLRN